MSSGEDAESDYPDQDEDYGHDSDFENQKPKSKKSPSLSLKRKRKALDQDCSDLEVAKPTKKKPATPSAKSKSSKQKTVEETYQRVTQLEHILLRPDTYVGSVSANAQQMWVYENDAMVFKTVNIVPGLYKIFDEILSNAADNKVNDPTMDQIRVKISPDTNTISVHNNGTGIPVEIHKDEKMYVPEMIFGHLLTSSNYDDDEKKVTGGRNGYGAKLCNIFSKEFIVETSHSDSKKKFKQVFRNNMSERDAPVVTKADKNDFTRITFRPDLARFGMVSLDDDILSLLKKRVYDMAGILSGVRVYLNDELIKIKTFKQYIELYLKASVAEDGSKQQVVYERPHERWEVAFTLSDGQFQQVSFVNNICTSKGGFHVNHVVDQIIKEIAETVEKKSKSKIKPQQIKNHLWIFVNCLIENPSFDSQTKENMTARVATFGSKCVLSENFMKKMLKSGIVDNIMTFAKAKQNLQLKKTDGHKTSRISGIPKLDDANNAGTKNGRNCTLILTEGDSAKALAVSGLSVIGRDSYGVFPLRGKLLNVRDATHKQLMDNAEISSLKKILGLQHNKEYKTVDGLRYGHLMLMTDQDHDGSHIKGLLINFLDHHWPSLLKIPGFLLEFITPIVKVTKGPREIAFYTIPQYEQWKETNNKGKGWTINSTKYKRKRWDADKAKRGELDRVLESIVKMVGESMGHKLSGDKKVIVAMGMGDFSSAKSRHVMFTRISGIPKLDDANNAGTKNGRNCTLILTEGDSAKALAVSGLSVIGRDSYGVFPLRGKLLNVRDATHKQLMDNAEISSLKKILGLQHNKEYKTVDGLRYGHLMLMTDQDHDGSHIKGLLINFLDHHWPSLLKIPGFLLEFITPIVKVTKGPREIAFYTIPQYEQWKETNNKGKGWTIKYYKGLGTSTAADAKKYFLKMESHKKPFDAATDVDHNAIDLAFNKKKADDRKEWIGQFTPGTFLDNRVKSVKIEDFVNKELIIFSMAGLKLLPVPRQGQPQGCTRNVV
ncbi:hypothetical protein SeMB42_g05685 [Synchytrium endobioticum]|uniref:DNA topoisomerase 2 n=1 Tax=Synchytrium endobioticum TaxID=286115 RepID=A0A507CPX6_9FUNG|nr:hypothetical protein SeMB42_g05685 [Synchytrium endobioticum]